MKARCTLIVALAAIAMPALALAQSGTFNVRQLTPETAAKATRAALDAGDSFDAIETPVRHRGSAVIALT